MIASSIKKLFGIQPLGNLMSFPITVLYWAANEFLKFESSFFFWTVSEMRNSSLKIIDAHSL